MGDRPGQHVHVQHEGGGMQGEGLAAHELFNLINPAIYLSITFLSLQISSLP